MTVLETPSELSVIEKNSWAELGNSSLLGQKKVTVCARFLNYQIPSEYQNILVFSEGVRLLKSEWVSDTEIYGSTYLGHTYLFSIWKLQVWNHVCIMIDSVSKTVQTVLNGKIVATDRAWIDHSALTDSLTIMGSPDNERFSETGSLFGRMTDVQIWSSNFSQEEAETWTLCQNTQGGGDLLDWNMASWRAVGLQEVQVERGEVCREEQQGGLWVSGIQKNFDDSVHFVSLLGGEIAVADSNQTMQQMLEAFSDPLVKEMCGSGFYTGLTDREVEGRFVNVNTGEELRWDNWYRNQPDNWRGKEDCTDHRNGQLNDGPCYPIRCPIINMTETPQFQLRGACDEVDIDIFYTLVLNKTLLTKELLGFKHTKISWSSEDMKWTIVNLFDYSIVAFTNYTSDYPFGTHPWFFTSRACRDPGKVSRELSLQQKSEQPGQFCCDDGICIDSEERCDGNKHCRDYSDERSCQMVEIPATCNSDIPPSRMQKRGKKTTFRPIDVQTYVEIQNILAIDEEAQMVSLRYRISFVWIDYQLTYRFIKTDSNKNVIQRGNSDFWIPEVKFSILLDQTKSIEVDRRILVKKQGAVSMTGGMDVLHPNETYSGNENTLTLEVMYQANFFCDFAGIAMYPFDVQECTISLQISGASNNLTRLIAMPIQDQGPSSVGQYDVTGWTVVSARSSGGQNELRITAYLGRNVASVFFITYLPTILMNLINQATNYSKDSYELVITVNITCMMVLASVYISVSNSLPATAAIKNIEVWLLFNLAYPVMVIVVNIFLQVNNLQTIRVVITYLLECNRKGRN